MGTSPTTQPGLVPATAPSTQPVRNLYQDAGYGIGYDLGKNITESKIAIDTDKIIEGLRDCLAGKDSQITPQQFQMAMTQVQMEMQARQEEIAKEQAKVAAVEAEKNGAAGAAFRAENGKKPGIVTTASGLQVETIKEGTGAVPKATDTVKVHYTGKLIDGKTFDSSVDRGEPVSFPLDGVIKGWTEGLQQMKVGGKAKLVIPAEIAYGPEGAGATIPPNATLVFDVELLEIVPPTPTATSDSNPAATPATQPEHR